jgi:tryptophanyl-tRNA synthetase
MWADNLDKQGKPVPQEFIDEMQAEQDIGVNMGLYNYPILMSADILLFDSDLVPVGRDQRQHIEFARDIAGSVNAVYGEGTCKLPEGIISEATMEIPGLDGRKMSKSYGNVVPIFAEASEIEKICKRVKTDSKLPEEPKDKDNLVYLTYRALATPAELADFEARFLPGGMGYGTAKKELAALHEAKFGKARDEYTRLLKDPGHVNEIMLAGAPKPATSPDRSSSASAKPPGFTLRAF